MVEPTKPGEPAKPGVATPTPAPGSPTPATPAPGAATPATPPTPPAGEPKPGVAPQTGAPAEPGAVKPEPQTVPIGALLDERGKRQALEAEINLLKQQPPAAPYQPQTTQPQYAQPQQDVKAQMDSLWQTNPRQAVESQIMMSIDWYDRVNNSLDQQADALATKYPDFNTHRTAATRYVRSMPANQRSLQGVLESAYFYVKGQNVDTIMKAHEEELLRKYQAGELVSTPAGTQGAPTPQPGSVPVTDEQRNVAEAMGVSVEDYVANIKTQPAGR